MEPFVFTLEVPIAKEAAELAIGVPTTTVSSHTHRQTERRRGLPSEEELWLVVCSSI